VGQGRKSLPKDKVASQETKLGHYPNKDEHRTKIVTGPPEALLSYTRLDDEYFGGAITSLRRLLELGVQVVTGDRTFNIFQDVDGIEFGQKWKKRLTEAISTSRFLIPIVTPLFFKSDPCRDELKLFIEHEKSLGRDDLILPIYFVTTPVLERPELLKDDTLASEISSRQRYDWRVQADLPSDDPQIRRAVRALAEKIATAIARTSGPAPAPAIDRRRDDAADNEAAKLVKSLGPEREMKNLRKVVLWVDDRPNNNIIERHSMEAYNIDFVLAQSTGQALAELRKQQFDAIISDMGRPPDPRAGYTLLEAIRDSGDHTPYFIYAGSRDPAHVREARSRGAQGTTNMGDELLQMLLQALNV
jgi:CheY-like chemotaxis protein